MVDGVVEEETGRVEIQGHRWRSKTLKRTRMFPSVSLEKKVGDY